MTAVASLHLADFPLRRSISRFVNLPAERWELNAIDGCVLGKVLSTTAEGTTAVSTDLRRWAIFAVWQDAESRTRFVTESSVMDRWRHSARSIQHLDLLPLSSTGSWGGVTPFAAEIEVSDDSDDHVAVLTRATVAPTKVWTFTRTMPSVDKALRSHPDCSMAFGIGEWPLFLQGTFSVWKSEAAVRAFAHDDDAHALAVRRSYRERWFSEELFSRFRVESVGIDRP